MSALNHPVVSHIWLSELKKKPRLVKKKYKCNSLITVNMESFTQFIEELACIFYKCIHFKTFEVVKVYYLVLILIFRVVLTLMSLSLTQ